MRCHICNKDCADGEIKLEKREGRVKFSACNECTNVIQRAVLSKEIEDEETCTLPLWDIE